MKNLILKTVAAVTVAVIFTGCNAGHRMQEFGATATSQGPLGFIIGTPVLLTGIAINGGIKGRENQAEYGELWTEIKNEVSASGKKSVSTEEWQYYIRKSSKLYDKYDDLSEENDKKSAQEARNKRKNS